MNDADAASVLTNGLESRSRKRMAMYLAIPQNLWVRMEAVWRFKRAFSRHGKANEWGELKATLTAEAVRACGSFTRLGLVIPCRVARQQSPTPFHQTEPL
jgi:hypothetical protein